MNLFGIKGPREMTVFVPEDTYRPLTDKENLCNKKGRVTKLINKSPIWSISKKF